MNDAETRYGGGNVNTQTMGQNPYQQFAPKRMDQLFGLLGQRRPQQQQMGAPPPRQQPQYEGGLMGRPSQQGPQQYRDNMVPSSQMMMDKHGNWKDWIDPNAASLYNTGKVLPGSTARSMGQSDSSIQFTTK